jgi:inner membrane protein involved in colicin E2 resistance
MSNPTNRQTATRFAIIAALVLAMSIPLALVNGVADERQGFFDQTLADISATWGGSQQIAGPFLIIPEAHKQQLDIEDGQVVSRAQRTYQIVLPTQLELDIQIDHEMRHRAIYEVPVYRAQLQAKGSFDAVNTILQSRSGTTLLLDQAFIAVGISHSQAISAASALKLADANATFSSGTGQNWLGNGIKARVIDFNPDKPIAFEFDLAVLSDSTSSRWQRRTRPGCNLTGHTPASPAATCPNSVKSQPLVSQLRGRLMNWPERYPRTGRRTSIGQTSPAVSPVWNCFNRSPTIEP